MKYRRHFGLSLVELLVALAIGSVLIAGAVYVYLQSSNSYRTNDVVARLQENARYAFQVLEPDVRMSSFWGLVNDPDMLEGRARSTESPSALVPASGHDCGANFAVDAYNNLQATDASYTLTCAASGTVQPDADTLTVRRASAVESATPLTANRLRVWTTRTAGRLFSDGVLPGAGTPTGQVHDMIVNAYYVSQGSDADDTVPSLRRKALTGAPAAAAIGFVDEEIISGVEDLQVQFGIDPTGSNESATQYLNPGATLTNALNAGAQVISVRVWLLMRAERPETGYVNTATYTYGNRSWTPNDGFRRLLVPRTIQVRNSLG